MPMSVEPEKVEAAEKNARLPLLDPASLNPDQHELYERLAAGMVPWAKQSGFEAQSPDGKLLGPFNAMLYSPEMGAAQLNTVTTERDATTLDARVREVVILTVGAVCKSDYELYAHRAVAAKAGLAAEDIKLLATGAELTATTQLRPTEQAAYRFVRAITKDHRVPGDIFADAQKLFGHKGLVDMLHLAGLYMAISAVLNVFEVPVPE